mmetsp:Transcript_29128/g.73138  ORF Transcript_29128/g.73138 Transcript_29128/m.73138 type:complete len:231 (-) Transcript_29128:256-948(-)
MWQGGQLLQILQRLDASAGGLDSPHDSSTWALALVEPLALWHLAQLLERKPYGARAGKKGRAALPYAGRPLSEAVSAMGRAELDHLLDLAVPAAVRLALDWVQHGGSAGAYSVSPGGPAETAKGAMGIFTRPSLQGVARPLTRMLAAEVLLLVEPRLEEGSPAERATWADWAQERMRGYKEAAAAAVEEEAARPRKRSRSRSRGPRVGQRPGNPAEQAQNRSVFSHPGGE